jgi:hypothetical protein
MKLFRCDPNDRGRFAIDEDLPADDSPVLTKRFSPVGVTQNYDGFSPSAGRNIRPSSGFTPRVEK